MLKNCLTHAMYDGYYGAAVWATDHLIMNKDFFKKFDFKIVDEESFGLNLYLLARSFSKEFSPPKFLKSKFSPVLKQDVYNVELFFNPWCPYSYGVAKRAESLLNSCGEKINLKSHQLTQREDINKYNLSAGIFINGCDCSLDFLMGKDVLEILSQVKETEYAD
ncbi:MAG: hypothetical protein HYU63_00815 [Armatimonadetes bacterium]|nr:hypothetical protein [Armatimonadota bacterium]